MDAPYRFIIIDSDEINSFVTCKAIMLASRETVIQSFTDPAKGTEYIKSRADEISKTRTILFVNADIPDMKAWDFVEDFQQLESRITSRIYMYILSTAVDRNDHDYVSRFPYVKGFLMKPLSTQLVAECMISSK